MDEQRARFTPTGDKAGAEFSRESVCVFERESERERDIYIDFEMEPKDRIHSGNVLHHCEDSDSQQLIE